MRRALILALGTALSAAMMTAPAFAQKSLVGGSAEKPASAKYDPTKP